ncbi:MULTISPECIES: hypothetical protein [unclassified Phaeobacter]|uniref:hypothetical protein n=1 Tax=unclassified Phaeobacter TaxID=2621772 RepID=UPI003A88DA36
MELTTSDMDDEYLLLDCFRSSICALVVASDLTYQSAAFSRRNVLSSHVYLNSPSKLGDSIYHAISASHAALDFAGRTSADAALEVAAFAVTSVGETHQSGKAVRDILRKSLFFDATVSTNAQLLGNKLWNEDAPILQLQVQWESFIEHCKKHSHWLFWRDWYQGFLDGKPLDWELQRRVALIDDTFWDAGPEAVAAEIERIRAEFSGQPSGEDRFPKHEPKSVSHLFDNRVIASASLQGLATQVTHSIERFHAETGANTLPEALEPLTALPALLLTVNSTIQTAPHEGTIPSETEDQLRAEIGRLNAKVAELQEELRQASDSKPSVFSDAFKKQLGTSLGDWKLYAALFTSIWFVSGDIEGMQRRLEDISHYRDMIFGEVSSPSGAALTHSTAEIEAAIEI